MSHGVNRAMLLGNLGADPELRFTQGGQPVLTIRLATTESYLDKDKVRRERTDWHNVVVWGKRGEALAKILTKGSAIFVEGSIRTSSYDDRDGNKRYKTEIIASNVVLAGGRRGSSAGDDAGDAPDDFGGGDFGGPAHGSGSGGGSRAATPSARNGGGSGRPAQNGGSGAPRGGGGGRQAPPQDPGPPADDFGYDGGDDIPF